MPAREAAAEQIEELTLQLTDAKTTMGDEIARLSEALRNLEETTTAEREEMRAKIALLEETLADTQSRLAVASETLSARNHAGHRAQQALAVALKLLEEHTVSP